MLSLILATTLLQAAPPSSSEALARAAGEWRRVPGVAEEISYDTVPVERNATTVTIRLRNIRPAPEGGNSSQIVWVRLDCVGRTGSARRAALFGTDGRLLNDMPLTGEIAAERPANPGTPGLALINLFCPASTAGEGPPR